MRKQLEEHGGEKKKQPVTRVGAETRRLLGGSFKGQEQEVAGSGESLDCRTSSPALSLTCVMWSRAQTSWVPSFLLENDDFLKICFV